MKFVIHGKNIDLTPAIKAYIEEKLGGLERFLQNATELAEIRVEVGKPSLHHKSGLVYYAEVNLRLGRKLLRATTQNDDLYTAINEARDQVEIQIKKFKGKQQVH